MNAALKTMATATVLIVIGLTSAALGRGGISKADAPWNPEHISQLPKEITTTLARLCLSPPSAAHYFATYLQNSTLISLHYEHLHCTTRQPLCTQAGCLHELYQLNGGAIGYCAATMEPVTTDASSQETARSHSIAM